MLDQSSSDPQSWNLYVYAGNSPLKYTDPLGLWKQVNCEGGSTQCWEAEEGDTLDSLAEELGVSADNLKEFFQNQEVIEGRVFDVTEYAAWVKQGPQNLLGSERESRDRVEQWSRVEPPMGGGLKTVGKKSGLFGWIGRQAGRFGRWTGIIKPKQAATVAQLAAKQLAGSSGKEMLRDAVNITKAFKGTPQQKAELLEEFFKQISQRTGGQWNATRQISSDGSAIWTGDAIGRVLVVSPKGEIFSGNLTTDIGGFIFGKGGVMTPVYEKLTKIQ